jgi:hypothetical protein
MIGSGSEFEFPTSPNVSLTKNTDWVLYKHFSASSLCLTTGNAAPTVLASFLNFMVTILSEQSGSLSSLFDTFGSGERKKKLFLYKLHT